SARDSSASRHRRCGRWTIAELWPGRRAFVLRYSLWSHPVKDMLQLLEEQGFCQPCLRDGCGRDKAMDRAILTCSGSDLLFGNSTSSIWAVPAKDARKAREAGHSR